MKKKIKSKKKKTGKMEYRETNDTSGETELRVSYHQFDEKQIKKIFKFFARYLSTLEGTDKSVRFVFEAHSWIPLHTLLEMCMLIKQHEHVLRTRLKASHITTSSDLMVTAIHQVLIIIPPLRPVTLCVSGSKRTIEIPGTSDASII